MSAEQTHDPWRKLAQALFPVGTVEALERGRDYLPEFPQAVRQAMSEMLSSEEREALEDYYGLSGGTPLSIRAIP